MTAQDLLATIEDHALERVPDAQRKSWIKLSWNTAGLVTTLVMLFFGALVCFVAGVRIAVLAGLSSFVIGSLLGWALARVAYVTGCSNTLITRRHGLGVRGSALASLIFGFLIIGFLAVENALLYRGFLFFFGLEDVWSSRLFIYGGLTIAWIALTTFGFDLVTRFSSLMVLSFVAVMAWMLYVIVARSGQSLGTMFSFGTQLPAAALAEMGIASARDKYVFALNILLGPACALALNTADFGRYGRSTTDVAAAATIGIGVQSLLMMLAGGVLVFAAAPSMVEYYLDAGGMTQAQAHRQVLQSPDSIAATFMVFGGALGFLLMLVAQGKAQVLNTYSSSLCLSNLFDALSGWRPGRFAFVVLANVIAIGLLYGHLLEFVEAWIRLLGVLLSSLAGVIIADYYLVAPRLAAIPARLDEPINRAGVLTIVVAVISARVLVKPWQPVEALTALATVAVVYPLLRLTVLRPPLAPPLTIGSQALTGKET